MSVEWVTPKAYINMARQVMGGIDLDPASSDFAQTNVQAERYYTPDDDGLANPWFGRVWLSPPNGRGSFAAFTDRLVEDYLSGRVLEAIALVPNNTDTAWYHRLFRVPNMRVCLKTGRIRFETRDRKPGTPAQGQSFFYLGPNVDRFKEVFSPIGLVWRNDRPYEAAQAA